MPIVNDNKVKRKSKPRLTIEIDEHEHEVIKHYMEHGFQKKLFGTIVSDVVAMLEQYGNDFVLAMLARKVNMRLYLEAAKKYNEESSKRLDKVS
jgi:hypothetical protein